MCSRYGHDHTDICMCSRYGHDHTDICMCSRYGHDHTDICMCSRYGHDHTDICMCSRYGHDHTDILREVVPLVRSAENVGSLRLPVDLKVSPTLTSGFVGAVRLREANTDFAM